MIEVLVPPPPQNDRAGSTAVVALLRGRMLHMAWLGDSQAVLFRRGHGLQLVDPHKPDREVGVTSTC